MERNIRSWYAFWISQRWFAFRLDWVTIGLSGVAAITVVPTRDSLDPSLAGLALLYVTSLGGMFQVGGVLF